MVKSESAAAKARPRAAAGADRRVRQTRGEARKERILAAAIELFATRGYRGTSVTDLAERVGMTHPGLLYYFGTKERLLQEAVAARETREAAYLGSLGADASVFRLDEVARFALDAALLTRLYHVLATENLDPGDPLHAFFVTRYDKARRAVVAVLRKDQARGDVRADIDLDQVGYEVLGMLMGLEIQWLMDPDRVDLVGVMQGYVEGLRARLAP